METRVKQALLIAAAVAGTVLSIAVARADALACIQDRPWKGDESKGRLEDPLQDPLGASKPPGDRVHVEPWNGPRGATVR